MIVGISRTDSKQTKIVSVVMNRLSFGKSLVGSCCTSFHALNSKSTEHGGSQLCSRCGDPAWRHEMIIENCSNCSNITSIFMKLFCSVRNARVQTSPIGLNASISILRKVLGDLSRFSITLQSSRIEGATEVLEAMADLTPLLGGVSDGLWRIRYVVRDFRKCISHLSLGMQIDVLSGRDIFSPLLLCRFALARRLRGQSPPNPRRQVPVASASRVFLLLPRGCCRDKSKAEALHSALFQSKVSRSHRSLVGPLVYSSRIWSRGPFPTLRAQPAAAAALLTLGRECMCMEQFARGGGGYLSERGLPAACLQSPPPGPCLDEGPRRSVASSAPARVERLLPHMGLPSVCLLHA